MYTRFLTVYLKTLIKIKVIQEIYDVFQYAV